MAGRINSNAGEFAARLLGVNQQEQQATLKRIASGLRINAAGDDAAGLAISERLNSLSRGFEQAQRNIQDSASALQVGDGGLSQISDSLQRIRELTVQASNDTLNDADREIIQTEVDQLVDEVSRQAGATQFNGRALFTGDFETGDGFQVQAGAAEGDTIALNLSEINSTVLGIAGLDVSTRDSASAAIASLDSAINRISTERADIGSVINRLDRANEFVGVARENTLSALTTLRDADIAKEATNLALSQIRGQSNLSAIAQGNLNARNVLNLLGQ